MRPFLKNKEVLPVRGKDVRLKQLFKHSDRLFILPMDHGVTVGPVNGLTDINSLVSTVNDKIDAVVVHKGLVPQISDCVGSKGCGLIIHLSASTSLAPDANKKELVTSVEHAVRLGATCVSVHVNLGSAFESAMLKDLGNTAEQCEWWGIPLLAMMYVRDGSSKSEYDLAKIKHAARVAEELGADIVKVNYFGTAESFKDVVQGVKIPVIIAGGPRISSDYDLLSLIHNAIAAGVKGVAIGRNVFQHPNPAALADAVRTILDGPISEEQLKELAAACTTNNMS